MFKNESIVQRVLKIYILGLLFGGRNPSACLLNHNKIVAMAEEERFTRIKHANMEFPIESIKFCIKEAKINLEDIDHVAVGWDASKYDTSYMAEFFLRTWLKYNPSDEKTLQWQITRLKRFKSENMINQISDAFKEIDFKGNLPQVHFITHHLAHAASTFYLSGFNEASILTVDGHGEEDCTVLWSGKGSNITKLEQINIPDSLGWFYTAFTVFLGFLPHDGEGKTMGLAPYGKKNLEVFKKMEKVIKVNGDGTYSINPKLVYGPKSNDNEYFTDWFLDIFGKPRLKDEPLTVYHKDLAFAAQEKLEEAVTGLAKRLVKKTGKRKLCLAGGTHMNCKLNGKLLEQDFVDEIFVIPMSADNGISLGAALVVAEKNKIDVKKKLEHVYFGPEFGDDEIKKCLDEFGLKYRKADNIAAESAKFLCNGNIIGWFQGRMECGARALGNRSILANPMDPEMKDKVNKRVKFREMWRPFCPSILAEKADEYFIMDGKEAPYMIIAYNAREGIMEKLPSVVHIDNSVRPQTVEKSINPLYWYLINEFGKLSGVPVILNTSFNIKGEHIICRPREAGNCFLMTNLDDLCIGNFIVSKKENLSISKSQK